MKVTNLCVGRKTIKSTDMRAGRWYQINDPKHPYNGYIIYRSLDNTYITFLESGSGSTDIINYDIANFFNVTQVIMEEMVVKDI